MLKRLACFVGLHLWAKGYDNQGDRCIGCVNCGLVRDIL